MTIYVDDGYRPHKWPGTLGDGDEECLAWKCAACGEWVREFGPIKADACPIDWRNQ